MVGRRRDGVELQIKANGQGFDKQLTREIAFEVGMENRKMAKPRFIKGEDHIHLLERLWSNQRLMLGKHLKGFKKTTES